MGYRYIGSKTRILDKILDKISSIIPRKAHIVDLMCGTATVSSALRDLGYRVTAVDLMTFSFHHACVALLFTTSPKFEKAKRFLNKLPKIIESTLFPTSSYEKMIQILNNLPPERGYFWKEFSLEGCPRNTAKPRNYFSSENAQRIDAIRKCIKRLHESDQISDLEHSLLLHDLIMASNDVANIAGTYGHYLSRLIGRAKSRLQLKPTILQIRNDEGWHNVFRGYAEDLVETLKCDLCYIDPPYMKRQYAANYHILETLAREDEPEAIGQSGLRPWRDQYSDFCTKTKIKDAFGKIFSKMKCSTFMVSYSQDGLLKINELEDFFSKFGKVHIFTLKNKRFKSNNSKLNSELIEYIIYLRT